MKHHDAIIIGGGFNSLLTAMLLAEEKQSVILFESKNKIGGMASMQEFHPGFKCNLIHDYFPWMNENLMKKLKLAAVSLACVFDGHNVCARSGCGCTCHKKPISKFEILDLLYEKYHLNFEIIDASISVSPTGLKKNYFSNSRKALEIGYKPNYTSLETIVTEIQFCL